MNPCLILSSVTLLQKLYDTLLFLLLDTPRTVKRHCTIQNHNSVKIPWFQNIHVCKLVFHDKIQNRAVQYYTTGNDSIDYKELTIVIIEIKVTAPLFSLGVSAGDTKAVQKKARKNAML